MIWIFRLTNLRPFEVLHQNFIRTSTRSQWSFFTWSCCKAPSTPMARSTCPPRVRRMSQRSTPRLQTFEVDIENSDLFLQNRHSWPVWSCQLICECLQSLVSPRNRWSIFNWSYKIRRQWKHAHSIYSHRFNRQHTMLCLQLKQQSTTIPAFNNWHLPTPTKRVINSRDISLYLRISLHSFFT